MTNSHPTPNQPTGSGRDGHNVIAVSFEDDRESYHAHSLLKELALQGQINLTEAAIVVREEDGQITQKDSTTPDPLLRTTGGGLIGLLLGIIGGPFGMLIGGATGMMVGSLYDLAELEDAESALGAISNSVKPGHPTLLARVDEPSTDVIDTAMTQIGGTVMRRPVAEVEAEIAAAAAADRKANHEARRQRLQARLEHLAPARPAAADAEAKPDAVAQAQAAATAL